MIKKRIISAALLIFTLFSTSTLALDIPYKLKSIVEPKQVFPNEVFDFEGIVKLSNCSGAIIKFSGQTLDSNALVLTNGHCVGGSFLRPGEAIYKKRVRRRMKVADKNMKFHRINATELVYATMTGTDSAIYKLRETYNDLLKRDIRHFDLAEQRPVESVDIDVVSGYWERGYRCAIDGFVHELKEASWIFTDAIRYTSTGCNTIGGTSGSPIIERGTRLVIGVNNTANESGRNCTMNNPCEVDESGDVVVIKGASYGQQTYDFYKCLNNKLEFDLSVKGCLLPK